MKEPPHTPEPMALATLAGLVAPNDPPDKAIEAAMRFYVEAILFCQEQAPKSFDELVRLFGTEQRRLALLMRHCPLEVLELRPSEHTDPVRDLLGPKNCGPILKDVKSYWKAVEEALAIHPDHLPLAFTGDEFIEKYKQTKNGKEVYVFPLSFVHDLKDWRASRGSAAKRKAWATRKAHSLSTAPVRAEEGITAP